MCGKLTDEIWLGFWPGHFSHAWPDLLLARKSVWGITFHLQILSHRNSGIWAILCDSSLKHLSRKKSQRRRRSTGRDTREGKSYNMSSCNEVRYWNWPGRERSWDQPWICNERSDTRHVWQVSSVNAGKGRILNSVEYPPMYSSSILVRHCIPFGIAFNFSHSMIHNLRREPKPHKSGTDVKAGQLHIRMDSRELL